MLRLIATLAALLVVPAVFAQGAGLKPSTSLGKVPAAAQEAAKPEGQVSAGPPPKSLEEIFACLADGLTKDWRSATIEVIEIGGDGKERQFETLYSYTRAGDAKPQRFKPCDDTRPAIGVHAFNEFLEPEKRNWKRAMLTFNSSGKFELKYDYSE